jgi:O-antigen/teichoic acid export membrane protein
VQYGSENHDDPLRRDAFYAFGFKAGMLFTTLPVILIALSPFYFPFAFEEVRELLPVLFLYPFLNTAINFMQVNLKMRFENHKYAIYNFCASTIHYLVMLPAAKIWGVKGAVYSYYVIGILNVSIGYFLNRKTLTVHSAVKVSRREKQGFLKLSVATQLNGMIDQSLMLLDVFLIGQIVAEKAVVASYKVASTIPTALLFIPSAVMVYAVPQFAKNARDKAWVKQTYKKIIKTSLIIYGVITVGCIALSSFILTTVFGPEYADGTAYFNVLMLGFFFSATLRITSNNVIYTQRRIKVNLMITITAGVLNLILDILFINWWGALGAAIATTTVMFISSILSFSYMHFVFMKRE